MRGAERVVFALRPLGEARKAAALSDGTDAVAAPGENLVGVALVADVPDQPVMRRVEDMVQRNRELHDAEAGAQMATGLGYRIDQVMAQLIGDLPKAVRIKIPQVFRDADLVEKRRVGWLVQRLPPCRRKGV